VALLWAVTGRGVAQAEGGETTRQRVLETIQRSIQFYNAHYSDIRFIRLRGGDDWIRDLVRVQLLMGNNARCLDYAHPPDLRKDLLTVSVMRVQWMLQNSFSSAALFAVGEDGTADRANLCVITLDPEAAPSSDRDATRAMLDLPDEVFARMAAVRYLDHDQHLEFVFDHEAYHCLDSYYNGPAPMSDKRYAGEYRFFHNEQGADAYGISMNLRRHGRITRHAENMLRVRALSLLNGDPNHNTYKAVAQVLRHDPTALGRLTPRQAFDLAGRIRTQVLPGYDDYVAYRAAAFQAMQELGLEPEDDGGQVPPFGAVEVERAQVELLIGRTEAYLRELFVETDAVPSR